MRRFDYDDNEEYREDVDNFFDSGSDEGITPDEYRAIVKQEQEMQAVQLNLAYRDMNSHLLCRAIKMLEKSFWWRFYSLDTRLKMIERTYHRLKRAVDRG